MPEISMPNSRNALHRIGARRLAFHGADAGGQNPVILAAPDGVLEKSFCHRAAANIAGANK